MSSGIITRFTLRSLRKNRARSIVSIIGIALSCALVTAIFTTVTSIQGGIVEAELESGGSWQVSFTGLAGNKVAELEADKNVTDLAVGYELGSAVLPDDEDADQPTYLAVKSLPERVAAAGGAGASNTAAGNATVTAPAYSTDETSDVTLADVPALKSGRLPEAAGEIALPVSLMGETLANCGVSCDGAIELGSTVTLSLGQRTLIDANGIATTRCSADAPAKYADTAGAEQLVDVREAAYTVVGFTSGWTNGYNGKISSSSAGQVALVATASSADAKADDGATAYAFATTGLSSYDDIKNWAHRLDGDEAGANRVTLHNDLLRYQGMTADRQLWNTAWLFAGILVAIVMVASVSLVYTSFAISVTERTRQLGLLSGIGASGRQLRRSVLIEALALGAVGIPAGLALGVAGTAATLSITQPLFSSILNAAVVGLHVDRRVLVVAAGVSLATLLVSAWIPAVRASRASAVDTMRQADSVKASRRRGRIGGRVAQALFGVSGLVAHRNLTRSGSRSRVVVASLAVSVMLVVVCGCIDAYITPIAGIAGTSGYPAGTDIVLRLGTAGEGTQAEARSVAESVTESFAEYRDQATKLGGVSMAGGYLHGTTSAVLSAGMVGDAVRERIAADADFLGPTPDSIYGLDEISQESDDARSLGFFSDNGAYAGNLQVYYVGNDEWRGYVKSLGLDENQYCNDFSPVAIAVGTFSGAFSDDGRYTTLSDVLRAGTATLLSAPEHPEGLDDTYQYAGAFTTAAGETSLVYLGADADGKPRFKTLPVDQADCAQTLQVGAVATTLPESLVGSSASASFPTLVLPMSTIGSTAGVMGEGSALACSEARLCLAAEDDVAVTKDLESLGDRLMGEDPDVYVNVYDIAESSRSAVNLAQLIRLFAVLFSVVTMLIALANVFNTLTNSIILRTREFAVLRSIGMGDAAFRRMMLYECASYALRGFVLGLLLAGGFSYLMWRALAESFEGLGVAMPAPYVLAAVAGTGIVLLASALYALRRSNAQNTVEALRTDAL